jgi:hypothetical protein
MPAGQHELLFDIMLLVFDYKNIVLVCGELQRTTLFSTLIKCCHKDEIKVADEIVFKLSNILQISLS